MMAPRSNTECQDFSLYQNNSKLFHTIPTTEKSSLLVNMHAENLTELLKQ
jgi:hypothetical protein